MDDISPWWVVVSTALAGVGGWLLQVIRTRHEQNRILRADALQEWRELASTLQKRCDVQQARNDEQERQIYSLFAENAKCHEKSATQDGQIKLQEGEIRLLQAQIRRLQVKVDDTAPGTIMPMLITATTDGVIKSVMGGAAPLLHWLPAELIGKNVKVLMPDAVIEAHEPAIKKMLESQQFPDPEKTILTLAKTKEGDEVPVSINLCGFKNPQGVMFLNAEVRRRERESPSS